MSPDVRQLFPGRLVYLAVWFFIQPAQGASFSFSNTNFIAVDDSLTPPTIAAPYPSSLTVTGLAGQVVTKATVTLHGLSHGFPSDIAMLLVGPQNQSALVMAQAGGQEQFSVTNLTLVLDDDAAEYLPIYSGLVSGTFKPTSGYEVFGYAALPYDFPAPAPSGNSNAPSLLAVFNNTDPSGRWDLYVVDDAAGHSGSIAGGWSLDLSVAVPLQLDAEQGSVVVSWPGSAQNASLQFTADISTSAIWTNVPTPPVPVNGRFVVTNSAPDNRGFYRLVDP
jgi:subtilisin-like proprotein convertase family protein